MKTLVNIFHPDIEHSTINKAWLTALEQSSEVTLNLPYLEYPNWQIDVQREQSLLSEHDRIIFQHPFMWYSIPPLMKKWLDDVLVYGWAYGEGGNALLGKEWLSAISTGVAADAYQAGGGNQYSMSELLKPLQQTANFIGMQYRIPFIFHGAGSAAEDDVQRSVRSYLAHISV